MTLQEHMVLPLPRRRYSTLSWRVVPGQSYQLPVKLDRRLGRTDSEVTLAQAALRFPGRPRTAENHRISSSSHSSGPVNAETTNTLSPTRAAYSTGALRVSGWARRRVAPTRQLQYSRKLLSITRR
jgi:hypothetical protein